MNTMQMQLQLQQVQLQLQLNKLILIKNKHTIYLTVTVMKYVMPWTNAPTFHHDLPFIPLYYIIHDFDGNYVLRLTVIYKIQTCYLQ
jgi:hypothetical protein